MPQNEWIRGAMMIPENSTYKVDGSGRIVIPSHLRNKLFYIINICYIPCADY